MVAGASDNDPANVGTAAVVGAQTMYRLSWVALLVVPLLAGVGFRWLVLPFGLALAVLLLAGRYGQVVAVLRWVLPGFLAFAAAAVLARPDWPRLIHASAVPALSLAAAR